MLCENTHIRYAIHTHIHIHISILISSPRANPILTHISKPKAIEIDCIGSSSVCVNDVCLSIGPPHGKTLMWFDARTEKFLSVGEWLVVYH